MALAASVKSLRLGNRKTQNEKPPSGIKQSCFKGNSNSNSEHHVIICAFLRYHLKQIPHVQQSYRGC
jgi:hypothetical protein